MRPDPLNDGSLKRDAGTEISWTVLDFKGSLAVVRMAFVTIPKCAGWGQPTATPLNGMIFHFPSSLLRLYMMKIHI